MQFIQARNFTHGRIERVRLIVVHDMESAEAPTNVAEAVAAWFGGSNAPKASAHYCIDRDSIVQGVRLTDTAWHAPGANADGVGYELAGKAAQTARDWADVASEEIIENAAKIMARNSIDLSIAPRILTDTQLADGRTSGITTHRQVSRVFKRSNHTDPGGAFPVQHLLSRVNYWRTRYSAPVHTPTKPANVVPITSGPVWPFGALDYLGTARADRHCHSGVLGGADAKAVMTWQRRMAARGWRITVDGKFESQSAAVAQQFRSEQGFKNADAHTVTPAVWHASWSAPIK